MLEKILIFDWIVVTDLAFNTIINDIFDNAIVKTLFLIIYSIIIILYNKIYIFINLEIYRKKIYLNDIYSRKYMVFSTKNAKEIYDQNLIYLFI